MTNQQSKGSAAGTPQRLSSYNPRNRYWPFALPATIIVLAVIVFPWLFTLYMSLQNWSVGSNTGFVGLENYRALAVDPRFRDALVHTLVFTGLATVAPIVLGTAAALVFNREFPLRGLFRTVFILPMMATPVAIALVWTMMFHPQLGVLNYVLTQVGIPRQTWVYNPDTVIPTLVMVEVWQWTPLVMLIVLGGLASLPKEPYESAMIDGANPWHMFRHITLPLLWPYILVAGIIRIIDAMKVFDTIFVITQGGPGTASETINIFLYLQAFAFYNIGYSSAVVVIFFIVIVLVSLSLMVIRQKTRWNAV
ncbi:multiple sugar transport system permease protein [Aminobacter lissarensis]|uniref:Multiple sugar transport system permease protein n=1 Tax=Aminobacter carboxidus TaxID=376165 RepID=A0A8E1WJR0_9HYPH|nr:multiple sugar transport system permease protein [Aminobacter lissarensis]